MKRRVPSLNQLRWQIVAGHMVVVVVGVVVVLAMTHLLLTPSARATLAGHAGDLATAQTEAEVEQRIEALLVAFRASVVKAVSVAAGGAILAALITGLLLARHILRPLHQLAASSQRVAAGRYGERVTVPASDELALVATSFNQMAESLEQVEEQRVTLIGNVAHELRTPLTALAGYLEALLDGLFPAEPETFHTMHQEVRRLQRLIDDLQALSRVEAGQISLEMVQQPLLPLVQQAVTSLQPQAESKGIRLVLVEPAPSPQVCADADRVVQILHNLVGNAIRYTPEGGRIAVSIQDGTRQVTVTVSDSGIGIPIEALPYLFERFYRVDSSRARHSGGSGIGLTIARHLAWAMGGELEASSPGPDQGSTFILTLPLF